MKTPDSMPDSTPKPEHAKEHVDKAALKGAFEGYESKDTKEQRVLLETYFPEISAITDAGEEKATIDVILKKFGVITDEPKKKSDEKAEPKLEDMSNDELRQKMMEVDNYADAKKIKEELGKESRGVRLSPIDKELVRFNELFIIENNYMGKEVTRIPRNNTGERRTGTVTGVQVERDHVALIIEDDRGSFTKSLRNVLLEKQEKTTKDVGAILNTMIGIDMDSVVNKDKDELVTYKPNAEAVIKYDDGRTLTVTGVQTMDDNIMGYLGTESNEDGSEKTEMSLPVKQLIFDIQNGVAEFVDTVPGPDNDNENEEEEEGDEGNEEETPRTIEQMKKKWIGKFARKISEPMALYEITDIKGADEHSARFHITDEMGRTRSITMEDLEHDEYGVAMGGYELVSRGEHLEKLQDNFMQGMEDDLKDMNAFKKFGLQLHKAVWGQDMETGLSKETKEQWKDLNKYLDRLTTSAEERWRNKGDYTDAQIEEMSRRYKARFMSGLQVRAERKKAEQEKVDELSNTWVGRTTKKLGKWWGKRDPRLRAAASYAVVAGTTAFAVLSGVGLKTRLVSMAAGMGAGTGARGLAEAVWRNSADADALRADIEAKQRDYNNAVAELKKIDEKKSKGIATPTDAARQNELARQITQLSGEFTALQGQIEESAGRINRKRVELEEKYNSGEVSVSEYMKKDADLEKQEARAETIKKLVATAAAIGTAVAAGGYMKGLEDAAGSGADGGGSGDPTPEDSDSPVTDEPSPLNPDYKDPDIPFDPDYTDPTPEELTNNDAIVRKGEGITHVYERQLDGNPDLVKVYEQKLGMDYESNKGSFLAKLAKEMGYIDNAGNDVRVAAPDVTAYQLNMDGTTTEFQKGVYQETHGWGSAFEKPVDAHEYSWDGSKQYADGSPDVSGTQPDVTLDKNGQPSVTLDKNGQPAVTLDKNGNPVVNTTGQPSVTLDKQPNVTLQQTPSDVLSSNNEASTKILDRFGTLNDSLKGNEYDQLVGMQADQLMPDSGLMLDANQEKMQTILLYAKESTGLEPLPYESVGDYLDRTLDNLGSDMNVDQIHEKGGYLVNVPEAEQSFIAANERQTYNNYLDQFFEKKGLAWQIEGADNTKFNVIGKATAQDVFYRMGTGELTAEWLKENFNMESDESANKLFNYFKTTKELVEANDLGVTIDSNTTMEEVTRKMTDTVTNKANQ